MFWSPDFGHEDWGPKLATRIGSPSNNKKKMEGSDFGRQFFATQVEFWSPIFDNQICNCWITILPHVGPRPLSSLQPEIRLTHETRMTLVSLSSYIKHALYITCCASLQDVTKPELQRKTYMPWFWFHFLGLVLGSGNDLFSRH